MARQRLAERTQLSLPTALGAVSREKRLGCPPRQGLRPGRGRRGKTISTRRNEKHVLCCTSKGSLGAAAPKRPFRPFWAVPKGPRAGARNTPWQGYARNTFVPGGTKSPACSGRQTPLFIPPAPPRPFSAAAAGRCSGAAACRWRPSGGWRCRRPPSPAAPGPG